jgi:hypothetical protein
VRDTSARPSDLPGVSRRAKREPQTKPGVPEIGKSQSQTRARGTAEIFAVSPVRVASFFEHHRALPLRVSAPGGHFRIEDDMKLGGRIAIYVWLVATECGVLFGFALLTPRADGSIQYAIRDNQEILRHQARMAEIKSEGEWMNAEQRVYKACMKRHADVSDPSIVDFCRSMAKLEIATARMRAAVSK